MQLLSRREYNLILRSLDKYELYMNSREKELSEKLQDKLYYNLYNPKDGVAQTNVDLSALYDIKTESASQNVTKEQTYAAQIELTNVPEDSLKQWTNMPPISEELYQELVKEFNNERHYFFNDSYNLED